MFTGKMCVCAAILFILWDFSGVLCQDVSSPVQAMSAQNDTNAVAHLICDPRPIILVHGFSGWGRDEMLGYKYWGGMILDIEEYLNRNGFCVYTASVGAISSNHDRACELFYQIKGGKINYGEKHSQHFHHKQYGKNCIGFYPDWSSQHPIHLVGHSMGGQTIRVLSELLAQDYFDLGTNEHWLKSITTISTPHNGTTLATMVKNFTGGLAEEIVTGFLATMGSNWEVYSFDMEQWDLTPLPKESISEFMLRLDKVLGDTQDISLHDLLPEGAKKLNINVRTFPNIYYISYATMETYVFYEPSGFHWAKPTMNPIFWVYACYMGHYQGPGVAPHSFWWPNDGVVNTISMKGPENSSIIDYAKSLSPGVWNYMGIIADTDHGKIVGHYQNPITAPQKLQSFYLNLAKILQKLP